MRRKSIDPLKRLPIEQYHHRKLETALQYRVAPLIAVLQATGTRSSRLALPERTGVNNGSGQQAELQ